MVSLVKIVSTFGLLAIAGHGLAWENGVAGEPSRVPAAERRVTPSDRQAQETSVVHLKGTGTWTKPGDLSFNKKGNWVCFLSGDGFASIEARSVAPADPRLGGAPLTSAGQVQKQGTGKEAKYTLRPAYAAEEILLANHGGGVFDGAGSSQSPSPHGRISLQLTGRLQMVGGQKPATSDVVPRDGLKRYFIGCVGAVAEQSGKSYRILLLVEFSADRRRADVIGVPLDCETEVINGRPVAVREKVSANRFFCSCDLKPSADDRRLLVGSFEEKLHLRFWAHPELPNDMLAVEVVGVGKSRHLGFLFTPVDSPLKRWFETDIREWPDSLVTNFRTTAALIAVIHMKKLFAQPQDR